MHFIFSVCMGGKSRNWSSALLIVRLFGGWSLVAQSSGWSGTSVGQLEGPSVVRSFGGCLKLSGCLVVWSFGGEVH
jgi:hypothetical protein